MSASKRPLLLRNRQFFKVWAAQIFAQGGNRIFQISVVWWMMTALPSGTAGTFTALFLISCALPAVVFAKKIGIFIDRRTPRSIMASSALAAGILLFLASVFFQLEIFAPAVVMAIGFTLAGLNALYDPSLQSGLGQIVEEEDVPKAIAVISSTQSLANFGGAVLGAFLIESIGMTALLALTGAGFVCASILILISRFRVLVKSPVGSADKGPAIEADVTSGSVLNRYPLLRRILIGFGFVNFFTTPAMIVLPLYVRKVLGGTAVDLGWLEASIWLGLIAGTLGAVKLTRRLTALQTGTVMMATTGVAFLIPGWIVSRPLYQVALFIVGFALGANNLRFIALFQETVASELKGRFFAMVSAVVTFTVPVSFLVFGFLGDRLSPQWLCLAQGFGILSLSAYFHLLEKQPPETSVALEPIRVSNG